MSALAMIMALIPPGFEGEKIVRGKASRFRQAAKVGMKFAFCETFLKVIGFQLRILFTSLLIYFETCIYQERLESENCNPDFRGFMRRRNLAKRSLTFANFHLPPERIC